MQQDFILLDRSGSMESLWSEAIGSVNAYARKLEADAVETAITVATFDAAGEDLICFDIIRSRVTPDTWTDIGVEEVKPRGMTPLNDAVARVINLAEEGAPEKVAIIIMTDGKENASREYSVEQIKAKLDNCRKAGWQVIFLGANYDNVDQAMGYGASLGTTLDSMPQESLMRSTVAIGEKRAVYAATGASMEFTEAEKAQLRQKANPRQTTT